MTVSQRDSCWTQSNAGSLARLCANAPWQILLSLFCRCRGSKILRFAVVVIRTSPHEKSARGKIITKLICLLLLYRRPHKKSSHYRIAHPPRQSRPGRQFTGKNSPDGFLRVNCRPGRLFLGGDPIMGHRRYSAAVGCMPGAYLTPASESLDWLGQDT